MGNGVVTCVKGEQILGKWRKMITNAVSEGADYEEYTAVLLPPTAVTTESDKLALNLLNFELVDVNKLDLPVQKTIEETTKQV